MSSALDLPLDEIRRRKSAVVLSFIAHLVTIAAALWAVSSLPASSALRLAIGILQLGVVIWYLRSIFRLSKALGFGWKSWGMLVLASVPLITVIPLVIVLMACKKRVLASASA